MGGIGELRRRGSAGVPGGGGPGLSPKAFRATNFPGQRDISRSGGRDFSPLVPSAGCGGTPRPGL